jgi:CRP-like cAMP-binding protein
MNINEIVLFEGFDSGVIKEIKEICLEENYTKNTLLFKKDAKADCLYILEEGTVNLVIKNRGTLVYSLSKPGDVFGWSSLVDPGLYTADAVCFTDVKALKIERERLYQLFERYPAEGFKVLRRLGGIFANRLSNAYRDLLSARGQDTTPSYG